MAGSILVGLIVDAFEPRYVIAAAYLLRALSYAFLFAFAGAGSGWLIVAFAVTFGPTYMANMPPTSVFLRNAYGSETIGPTVGWLSMTHHLGGAGGVLLAGILYERLDGYTVAFVASVAVLLAAVVSTLILPRTRGVPDAPKTSKPAS